MRLIKKVLLQTFPGYGEAVTKTPAELNAATVGFNDETITGAWTFQADPTISGNGPSLLMTETDATVDTKNWKIQANGGAFTIRTANDALPGSTVETAVSIVRTGTEVNRVEFQCSSVPVARALPVTSGSLQIADDVGAFAKVARIAGTAQLWDVDIVLANTRSIGTRNLANNADRSLIGRAFSSDNVLIGSNNLANIEYRSASNAASHSFESGGVINFTIGNQGASVLDRAAAQTFRRVAYRDPQQTVDTVSFTVTQAMENSVRRIAGDNVVITLASLEAGTCIRFLIANQSGTQIDKGVISNMRWYGGAGSIVTTSPRQVRGGSVFDLYWESTNNVAIAGNGIS